MTSVRNSRADVVAAAGRLFGERGYHGTSMRDLGRELGLFGSSLYSHVHSKQDLLVEVIEKGAALFQSSADRALETAGGVEQQLHAFVAGHVAVLHGVRVGADTLVGIGAKLLSGTDVGPECVIAAGAVLAPGMVVPPRSVVMGVPGRVVRAATAEEIARTRTINERYRELARRYAAGEFPTFPPTPGSR